MEKRIMELQYLPFYSIRQTRPLWMTWQFIYCDKDVQDGSGSDGMRELRVYDRKSVLNGN